MNLYCRSTLQGISQGIPLTINIVDLDAFIHAEPDADIAVQSEDGDQFFVQKRNLRDFSFFRKD